METMLAYCGLTCDACLIHMATIEPDKTKQQTMRESIAEQLSKLHQKIHLACDINDCDGCRSNAGMLFSSCSNCGIRNCASGKNVENCAYCDEYVCAILQKHFKDHPKAKAMLDNIRFYCFFY